MSSKADVKSYELSDVIHIPIKAIGEMEAVVPDKGYHLIIFEWHINLTRITIPLDRAVSLFIWAYLNFFWAYSS